MSEIVDLFQRLHRDAPGRALVHLPAAAHSLTVADIWSASLDHRRALAALGLDGDRLVLLAIGNRPEVFPCWLACRAAGIPIMPVDIGATPAEIRDLAARFGATVAIVPDAAAAGGALGPPGPFVSGLSAVRLDGVESRPDLCRGAAVLKVTSGSTGLPKATFTTERELVIDTAHITEAMGIGPDDTQIASIPLSHAYGLGNLLVCALVQGTPVVLRENFVPHALPADAHHYGARVFPGVPFMFDHLATSIPGGAWPATLRTLMSAGARLEQATVQRFFDTFGVKIHSFYGTSETGGIAYDDGDEVREEGTVGRPMPGVSITLQPEQDAPSGSGRVHVSGSAVASRYAGERPGDGAFVDGGFLTGDFGRLNQHGDLVLTGRASLFINVAGRKVQPDEVERVLRSMPSIADVRVLGAPDAARGQQIVACVVPADGSRNVLALRQFCAARLAAHKLPRVVVWLERIPLTARGKTDRQQLEALVRDQLAALDGPDRAKPPKMGVL